MKPERQQIAGVDVRDVSADVASPLAYSICTLVSNLNEYDQMIKSFLSNGFDEGNSEFIYIDNSNGNRLDGFAGLRRFLLNARGNYILFCHQDVRLETDGRGRLDEIIQFMNRTHADWGVIGNAGGIRAGKLAMRISDPHGENRKIGALPARCDGLDENFFVVRREANLASSRDLSGFHLYAADLCLNAAMLGHGVYVVDFHLRHLSAGNTDKSFYQVRNQLLAKHLRFRSKHFFYTPSTFLFLTDIGILSRLMNSRVMRGVLRRYGKIVRRFGW